MTVKKVLKNLIQNVKYLNNIKRVQIPDFSSHKKLFASRYRKSEISDRCF